LEAQCPPRRAGGARVRARRRPRTGAGLAGPVRAGDRATDRTPGRLGGPGRTRGPALPPAPARPGRHRPRPRPGPSPCLPACTGPAAGGGAMSGAGEDAPLLDPVTRRWALATAGLALLPLLLILPSTLAGLLAVVASVVTAASWRRPLPAW